jgi:uroporphyrinogen decarboxylase
LCRAFGVTSSSWSSGTYRAYVTHNFTNNTKIVQVFDSWAGELSPSTFKEFSLPYLKFIADVLPGRIQELGLEPVPMVVFAKGAWFGLDALCDLGYQVVGLDWTHDPAEALKVRGNRPVVFQGNADPGIIYGTKEVLTSTVEDMVKGFGGGKQGWIANLGHGMSIALSA